MRYFLLLSAVTMTTFLLSGCATRKPADGQIYPGDAPSIVYTPPPTAASPAGK